MNFVFGHMLEKTLRLLMDTCQKNLPLMLLLGLDQLMFSCKTLKQVLNVLLRLTPLCLSSHSPDLLCFYTFNLTRQIWFYFFSFFLNWIKPNLCGNLKIMCVGRFIVLGLPLCSISFWKIKFIHVILFTHVTQCHFCDQFHSWTKCIDMANIIVHAIPLTNDIIHLHPKSFMLKCSHFNHVWQSHFFNCICE